ncbi:hypothetical protein DSO57_1023427 [Entomophthora muscae]|uniref:Uncharacterized protein n=1 Tax=Entomophthora muscae TaxID=34485 RepID=A0ACC2UDQ8_9FUNG|nr:hypothetical protein DSO57_1023427 [Entomophthora muscae]
MTDRGRNFIGGEFARLLQDWYQPTEELAPAEIQVYGGDACLVIGKVLEEFALMQAKYKLLTNHSPLLENDNSSKLIPGYNPGHTLGTGDQKPHTFQHATPIWRISAFSTRGGWGRLVNKSNLCLPLCGWTTPLVPLSASKRPCSTSSRHFIPHLPADSVPSAGTSNGPPGNWSLSSGSGCCSPE